VLHKRGINKRFPGKDDGLGVENLKYAGMIAGETSAAYEEVVTISMVSCRAIGIGSYVVRLGQRVIQIENSHIILRGYSALNKVSFKELFVGVRFHENVPFTAATRQRSVRLQRSARRHPDNVQQRSHSQNGKQRPGRHLHDTEMAVVHTKGINSPHVAYFL
jgi:Acetyl-CoA carboxylase, carboxyltransferase component (subunits alpha and beta)